MKRGALETVGSPGMDRAAGDEKRAKAGASTATATPHRPPQPVVLAARAEMATEVEAVVEATETEAAVLEATEAVARAAWRAPS